MIEVERKFIFDEDKYSVDKCFKWNEFMIEQSYIFVRKYISVRVRKQIILDFWDRPQRNIYTLTIKIPTFLKYSRYEIEVPLNNFLYNSLKGKKHIIKKRTELKIYHDTKVYIDKFIEPPLIPIVELEYMSGYTDRVPEFCGEEITLNPEWKNENIFKLL